jgi:hypothetical protein
LNLSPPLDHLVETLHQALSNAGKVLFNLPYSVFNPMLVILPWSEKQRVDQQKLSQPPTPPFNMGEVTHPTVFFDMNKRPLIWVLPNLLDNSQCVSSSHSASSRLLVRS